jgi:uncharacterized protein YjbI with pentapeptide repeats
MPLIVQQWLNKQMYDDKKELALKDEAIEYLRQSGLGNLMSNVLRKAEDEVKQDPYRRLTDATIAQIEALSYSFKPYKLTEGDSSFLKLLSPERGQLLLMLSGMNMDSVSFAKVLAKTSFAGADLSEADLSGRHLDGADLSGADLHGANMKGASLQHANLDKANLWGANLQQAHLSGASMARADLRWADLNGADLREADLHEADLSSAQLRKADLRGAVLQWTDFIGAFLNEADLTGADMFRASLKRANLSGANMSLVKMKMGVLSESNLTGTNLTGADLSDVVISEKDWLIRLDDFLVIGAKAYQDSFNVVDVISYEGSKYQLKRKPKN